MLVVVKNTGRNFIFIINSFFYFFKKFFYLDQLTILNSLHAGYYFTVFCRLLTFFKMNSFKNFFQEHYHRDQRFGPRSGLTKCMA